MNDPATALQALDRIESLLAALVSRDLDSTDVGDNGGDVRVVLAIPSWNDYLWTALDDLIEISARSPMVLLRLKALLTTLLGVAPTTRQPVIASQLRRVEEFGAGNYSMIWRDAVASGAAEAAGSSDR